MVGYEAYLIENRYHVLEFILFSIYDIWDQKLNFINKKMRKISHLDQTVYG